ncbi:hypothetical protein JNUCC1_01681 [Lentibacillus sp. JNUCC-1]|uniref:YcxB family protein n=1 Tax=Lentibacillus sp. JNUCC-1 TaxID=2654513 RepID=UPI0012E85A5B|nr:YcxB family protein [Lentibacillus sp. JNUCC-1]MUV37875.1 hypothetical protein [Lentibacillus sp. JNUCC-1]
MSNNASVSAHGALSYEEFKQFQHYHLRLVGLIGSITTFVLFAPILFIMMRIIFSDILGMDLLLIEAVLAFILSLVGAVLVYLWFKLIIRYRSSSEYKSDQDIRNDVFYTFGDDGIHLNRTNSNKYYDWSDVRSIHELQEMYLLYVSKYKAIILPKRFLETDEQKQLLKQIIRRNITTQKTKWQ